MAWEMVEVQYERMKNLVRMLKILVLIQKCEKFQLPWNHVKEWSLTVCIENLLQ